MILVTVGTHEQPFDRLIAAAAALPGDEPMVVQYGTSTLPHGRGEWIDFLSFDDLAQIAEQARAMVCHAGVGSIVLARRYGHCPIVMARRPQLEQFAREHGLRIASIAELWNCPITPATWSCVASLRKPAAAFSGVPESSSMTSSSFRPRRPPLALTSSIAIFAPRTMNWPAPASPGGESGVNTPIFTGFWAKAGTARPTTTSAAKSRSQGRSFMGIPPAFSG